MSVLSLSYWGSDVYWRHNNKYFVELAPQNGGKQLIWRNYVTVTLCITITLATGFYKAMDNMWTAACRMQKVKCGMECAAQQWLTVTSHHATGDRSYSTIHHTPYVDSVQVKCKLTTRTVAFCTVHATFRCMHNFCHASSRWSASLCTSIWDYAFVMGHRLHACTAHGTTFHFKSVVKPLLY